MVVANPSAVYRKRRRRRNDRLDAEFLARRGRADRQLLHPIQHRTVQAQDRLKLVRARNQIVQTRTKLVNHVRGAVKTVGGRISSCGADALAKRAASELPDALRLTLTPLLEVSTDLTKWIATFDRQLLAQAHNRHYRLAAQAP